MQASDQREVVSRAFSNVKVDAGPGALIIYTNRKPRKNILSFQYL